jgi:hypothetical protein
MSDRIGTAEVPHGVRAQARGVVFVHSCPRALTTHVEWALSDLVGRRLEIDWSPQPVAPATLRGELAWSGAPGTASRIVSHLHGWGRIRFEVTEEPTPGTEGERYSVTPALGVYRAVVGVHGDIQVPEERLRGALARVQLSGVDLGDELRTLLGAPWDAELEPFRYAGDTSSVRWLHQVVS